MRRTVGENPTYNAKDYKATMSGFSRGGKLSCMIVRLHDLNFFFANSSFKRCERVIEWIIKRTLFFLRVLCSFTWIFLTSTLRRTTLHCTSNCSTSCKCINRPFWTNGLAGVSSSHAYSIKFTTN
jgi:hypothetical protein